MNSKNVLGLGLIGLPVAAMFLSVTSHFASYIDIPLTAVGFTCFAIGMLLVAVEAK